MIRWLIDKLTPRMAPPAPPRPPKPEDDRKRGLMWVWSTENTWIEVCNHCGGNCGQCGITSRVGNVPFDLNMIVNNIGKKTGP